MMMVVKDERELSFWGTVKLFNENDFKRLSILPPSLFLFKKSSRLPPQKRSSLIMWNIGTIPFVPYITPVPLVLNRLKVERNLIVFHNIWRICIMTLTKLLQGLRQKYIRYIRYILYTEMMKLVYCTIYTFFIRTRKFEQARLFLIFIRIFSNSNPLSTLSKIIPKLLPLG